MTDTTTATDAGAADAAMASAATTHSPSDEGAAQSEEASIWAELRAADEAAAGDKPNTEAARNGAASEKTSDTAADTAAEERGEAVKTDGKNSADATDKGDQQKPDIWANAPPELKSAYDALEATRKADTEKYAKLEQENRSNRGRLTALQRQIEKLTSKDAGAKREASETAQGFFETKAWKEVAEEYPQLADKLKAAFEPLTGKLDGVEKNLSGIAQERTAQQITENYGQIVKDHPDYPQIKGSDAFADWYEQHKHIPAIADAVKRNAEVAVDPAEVSYLIKMFKADTGWKAPAKVDGADGKGKDQTKGQEQTATRQGGGSSETQTRAQTRTESRRDVQIESSASPRTTGIGAVTDAPPDDPQGAWEYWKRKGL